MMFHSLVTWFFFRPLPGGTPLISNANVVLLGWEAEDTYHSKN